MEFVVSGWCAGKYSRPDRTIRELDMFDHYSIIVRLFTLYYFLTKSNSATEVANTGF